MWEKFVEKNVILIKLFKKCGIYIAMVWIKGDILFYHNTESNDEMYDFFTSDRFLDQTNSNFIFFTMFSYLDALASFVFTTSKFLNIRLKSVF